MWDLMLTGLYTPPRILELANTEWRFRTRPTRKIGGKPLCRSAIYQIFTKPFYYGWFEYPHGSGQWYQGKHDPLITEAEYDRVQTLLGRNGNPRPQSHHEFAFTGLIRCGDCNRMVTAEEKHQVMCGHCRFKFAYRRRSACPRCQTPIEKMVDPLFLHYTYYHCSKSKRPSCTQKCVSGVELEKQIGEYLARIQISEQFKDWAIKYLHELHAQESATQTAIIEAQQKAYQECVQEINNLVSLKTSPGNADGSQLSNQEYGQRRIKLLKEKAALEELLQDTGQRIEQHLRLSEETFEFACTAQERFAKGNAKTKKEMLVTFGSNLTLKDKKLWIEARKPFFILGESMSDANPTKEPIEPKNMGLSQRQNGAYSSVCPNVLGDLHDVRAYGYRAERAAALIYAHFKKEFGFS
jgi:site-specific DNA recombinase